PPRCRNAKKTTKPAPTTASASVRSGSHSSPTTGAAASASSIAAPSAPAVDNERSTRRRRADPKGPGKNVACTAKRLHVPLACSRAAAQPCLAPRPDEELRAPMAGLDAQAFWIAEPGRGEVRSERLRAPGPDEVLVRTLFSGISRGTEALVLRGGVPPSEHARMRAPFQEGDFPAPVKYGYSNVGIVEQGPDALRGRRVFCL